MISLATRTYTYSVDIHRYDRSKSDILGEVVTVRNVNEIARIVEDRYNMLPGTYIILTIEIHMEDEDF